VTAAVYMNTFEECVQYVQRLPPNDKRINQETQLLLYGLYKVATLGAPPPKPPKSGLKESYKHQAWVNASLTCFTTDHAKQEYVIALRNIIENFQ
jgi:acyl-CoA-binding protein